MSVILDDDYNTSYNNIGAINTDSFREELINEIIERINDSLEENDDEGFDNDALSRMGIDNVPVETTPNETISPETSNVYSHNDVIIDGVLTVSSDTHLCNLYSDGLATYRDIVVGNTFQCYGSSYLDSVHIDTLENSQGSNVFDEIRQLKDNTIRMECEIAELESKVLLLENKIRSLTEENGQDD